MATARSALQGGAFSKWISGTSYGLDAIVWSPISNLTYRRIVAGAGTTDPSADETNWAMWGASRIKQVIPGTTQITPPATTATTAVSANMAKSELRYLGARETYTGTNPILHPATVAKDGSAVRATLASVSEQHVTVSWELTEWW